ncbi:extensin isoform X2 [Denticeps clupeoides]|uniref:extensin isoform X2 n=1 Tax=Denticeps clupeoides TaxID=299321 RepID=UPI0010A3A75C|nr:extensin-like isoform X2 [Denticeps clupeoides]
MQLWTALLTVLLLYTGSYAQYATAPPEDTPTTPTASEAPTPGTTLVFLQTPQTTLPPGSYAQYATVPPEDTPTTPTASDAPTPETTLASLQTPQTTLPPGIHANYPCKPTSGLHRITIHNRD